MTLQERIQQLRKAQEQIPGVLKQIAKLATLRAIEAAAEKTPPVDGERAKGANTITGELKQHWATDSVTDPALVGKDYQTVLANNKEYASYVNDGHRMDRHFVPGLYINPYSGLLEYDPGNKKVGITVGTKTQYVKGLHMVDDAKKAYQETVRKESARLEALLK